MAGGVDREGLELDVSFAKIGVVLKAGRVAPADGIESGKDSGPCTF